MLYRYKPPHLRKILKISILTCLVAFIIAAILWLFSDHAVLDVVATPKVTNTREFLLPSMYGHYIVRFDLPNLSYDEIEKLRSKVTARVEPKEFGSIESCAAVSGEVYSNSREGSHIMFRLSAKGAGRIKISFKFSDVASWPDYVRIRINSETL